MPPKHFLTSNFRVAFEEYFNPDQQRSAVDTLRNHIVEVRDGSEEQRRELGVLKPQDKTPEQIEQRVAAYLDKCYWQLSQFYRYSVPCRIDEAEPYLREVIRYAKLKGGKRDVAPELYLAVAIHKTAEKEQEAVALFTEAFSSLDTDVAPALGPRSDLWARAHWARLLRRVDRLQDAEAQEQVIVDWIVEHPLLLPPSKLKALVSDEVDSGVLNNILDHPQVVEAIQSAKEKRSGAVNA
ncbi:hypothetical protein PYCCODRAFT_1418423 [Trametes coccinea BRFM310]|uniref:Uncharacterized protein n=1 Tax=Trametes coccinea (strain BRFM310) TaxID=1353009 RepID=A0A1Y2IA28_TRAC3|nr:hypothetical protein PYCCODRAFT_1418423 [Trametes coccinea BRFM310]